MFFGGIESTQSEYFDHEDHKVEPHELFGKLDVFPLAKYFVLPNIDALGSNENIHNVLHSKMEAKSNGPLLGFGVEDIMVEFESPHISGFQSFKPCLDQEEDSC